jgi:hypothetical protein
MQFSFAQNFDVSNSRFPKLGVRVGYNYTCALDAVSLDVKWKQSANFGIVADFPYKGNWIIRPGIYLTGKGFKMRVQDIDYCNRSYNYLEAPLLAVYQKSISEKSNFELQFGPYFSYGVYGKSGCGHFFNYELCIETFDYYKHFDWGVNAGLGINVSHIYFGIAYDFGFVSIVDHALNHCFMANLGYNF